MKVLTHKLVEFCAALLLVYSAVFSLIHSLPADPARAVLGPLASPQAVAQLRVEYGLDRPVWEQYFTILGAVATGNLGHSTYYHAPAETVIGQSMPYSLARAGAALFVGAVLGLCLGHLLGQRSWARGKALLALLFATPSFCVMVLILWGGSHGMGWTPLGNPWAYEVLAVLGAALYPASAIGRQVADRLDVKHRRPAHVDFLTMLHAPRSEVDYVLWREALPEAVAILANSIPAVFTAVTFAEIVLNLRGFGRAFIESSQRGDLPMVIGGTLILSVFLLGFQYLGDALVLGLDPRITRHE